MSWTIVGLLVAGLLGLIVGGELLIRGASRLAAILGISPLVIGLTVVAFGTSAPELAVSLSAAFNGNADIALANVIGSNIFNILFILGLSALVSPLFIHSKVIEREIPLLIGLSLLVFVVCWNGTLSRLEGLIFFAGIVLYTWWLIREARREKSEGSELSSESDREYSSLKERTRTLSVPILLVGLGLVAIKFGADWLVQGAIATAKSFGVSDTVIGLTIVAAGTSLPEVVASVVATLKGERDIAVANVVGSNLYNILAILGISATIVPAGLSVNPVLLRLDLPVMIAATALCWPFFRTGRRLSRREGAAFLLLYIGYTTYLIVQAT